MTWNHTGDTTPRARKEHRCHLCGLRIRKGARYISRSGFGDDGPVTAKMHAVCESKTHCWDEDDWIYTDEGEFCSYWLNLPLIDLENVP